MQPECDRILRTLRERGLWHEVVDHEPVYTSAQASAVRGVPLEWGVKAMVLKTPARVVLTLVRADQKVDLVLIRRLEQASKIRLATPEEVLEATNCEIGSVPPFGFARPIPTYLDRRILAQEKVTFNAGLHRVSIIMRGVDLATVVDGVLY